MFAKFLAWLKGSKLAQAGFALVVLGAGVQALDELGAVDLAALPVLGKYAGAILAVAGVCKIALRLAVALLTALTASDSK